MAERARVVTELSSPFFGDPTPGGWVITLSYFVAGWYALRARRTPSARGVASDRILVVRGARGVNEPRGPVVVRDALMLLSERITWSLVSAVCFALGINKQLDLQTTFINLARELVSLAGLREYKWFLVAAFSLFLAMILAATVWLLVRFVYRLTLPVQVSVLGVGGLFAFVFARALQFQHVAFDGHGSRNSRLGKLLELSAIAIVFCGAALRVHFWPRNKAG